MMILDSVQQSWIYWGSGLLAPCLLYHLGTGWIIGEKELIHFALMALTEFEVVEDFEPIHWFKSAQAALAALAAFRYCILRMRLLVLVLVALVQQTWKSCCQKMKSEVVATEFWNFQTSHQLAPSLALWHCPFLQQQHWCYNHQRHRNLMLASLSCLSIAYRWGSQPCCYFLVLEYLDFLRHA